MEPLELIEKKALFVVNHSGGKDSQAMYIILSKLIPKEQLLVVHAHLPEVEWPGTIEHIQNTISSELLVVQAGKTFFQMVEHRQMFPSPKQRQCTSDLKRGPIETGIRRHLKKHPGVFNGVVNCMGMRAEESSNRAKKSVFAYNEKKSVKGRFWYDWLPIHHLLRLEVFGVIENEGQTPHWAYGAGMTRLSCCFCIMSSDQDLKTAGRLMPELRDRYIGTEEKFNHTLMMPTKKSGQRFLKDICK